MRGVNLRNMGAMMEQWTALFSFWVERYGTGQELIDKMLEKGYSEAVDMGHGYHTGYESVLKLLKELCPEKDGTVEHTAVPIVDENYWLAQYLVIYLWIYPRTLREIFSVFTYDELVLLYHPWHQTSERRFALALEEMLRARGCEPLEQIDHYKGES